MSSVHETQTFMRFDHYYNRQTQTSVLGYCACSAPFEGKFLSQNTTTVEINNSMDSDIRESKTYYYNAWSSQSCDWNKGGIFDMKEKMCLAKDKW